MNSGILEIEEEVAALLTLGSSEVPAIAHGIEEIAEVVNTETTHGTKENIRLLSKLAYSDEVQEVDGAQNLSVQTPSMVQDRIFHTHRDEAQCEADEARKAKDFDAGAVGNESFCAEGQNSSPTQHSSSLSQVSKEGYQAKASEAEEAKKTALAVGYREAGITSEMAADQFKLAALASAEGKENESNSWYCAGKSLQLKEDYQVKACEAEEVGKTILAAGYREAVAASERAADQYGQAALAFAAGKANEGFNCNLGGKLLQSQADYQTKARETQEARKGLLAASYREAVATLQRALDQLVLAYAAEKESEGNSCHYLVGISLQAKVDYQVKACEAEEAGKTTLAAGYKEAAVISDCAADQYRESALASAEGKESESISWHCAGKSLQLKAGYQAKASEAEEAKKTALAVGYKEVAAKSQDASDHFKQAVETSAVGKERESISWHWAGISLEEKVGYQTKAIEAEEAGKMTLAASCGENAAISERVADQYRQSALAYAAEREREGDIYYLVGNSLRTKVNYQVKACEAEEAGKIWLAIGYREAAATLEHAADYLKQAAETSAVGKESESSNWHWAGASLQAMAGYQAKACEAQEVGKTRLAVGYREAAATLGHAADQFQQASAAGKESESNSWYCAGKFLYTKADYQAQASEPEEARKENLAAGYHEATEIFQRVAEYYQQAGEAFAIGKEDEGIGWLNVARFLQSKADDQIKNAEKAEEVESQKSINLQNNRDTHSVNPSAEYALTNHQSDPNYACRSSLQFPSSISYLPSPTAAAVPTAYSLQSTASIRPASIKIMALSVCCKKWLAETRSSEASVKILSDYVIDVLKRGADHELVRVFEKYWDHIAKAHDELEDNPLTLADIQVAEDIQRAIEDNIKQAEASKNKNEELSTAWKDAVQATQKLAECREKYIQISISSKTPDIISDWKKIVEGSEFLANYFRKAAEARALQNEQEYESFKRVANSMKESVNKLEEEVTEFEKSLLTSVQPEVLARCRKTIEQYKTSIKLKIEAGEKGVQENIKNDCTMS
ncbi:MAG TPA: hypothetical protein VJK54_01395 [Chthoniobacterales bacterium]|nr:hypothetical protein [Chthoniobacterales bacterium]